MRSWRMLGAASIIPSFASFPCAFCPAICHLKHRRGSSLIWWVTVDSKIQEIAQQLKDRYDRIKALGTTGGESAVAEEAAPVAEVKIEEAPADMLKKKIQGMKAKAGKVEY